MRRPAARRPCWPPLPAWACCSRRAVRRRAARGEPRTTAGRRRRLHQRLRRHRLQHRRRQGRVSSIINRTSQDPHSYEATTQDKLAVSKAELVVENGGGYDDFIHTLADDTGLDHGNVINAVDVSGLAPAAESPAAASPDSAGHTHEPRGSTNTSGTACRPCPASRTPSPPNWARSNRPPRRRSGPTRRPSRTRSAAWKPSSPPSRPSAGHAPVAVTEPVPLYLLEDAGLENRDPGRVHGGDRGRRRRPARRAQGRRRSRWHPGASGCWPTTPRPRDRRRRR